MATDRGELRAVLERFDLACETFAVHHVVGVHARDVSATTRLYPGVQGGDDSPLGHV